MAKPQTQAPRSKKEDQDHWRPRSDADCEIPQLPLSAKLGRSFGILVTVVSRKETLLQILLFTIRDASRVSTTEHRQKRTAQKVI